MTGRTPTRRHLLRTTAGVLPALLAGCSGGSNGGGGGEGPTPAPSPATTRSAGDSGTDTGTATTAGATTGGSALGAWLSDVSNYSGSLTDRTGQSEVTVEVGVQANGGAFGFGPPAVRISTATTVKWKWTGKGGQHNVVAQDGSFESDLYATAGVHFEHAFGSAGTYTYYCAPHRSLGMKGAVVVE